MKTREKTWRAFAAAVLALSLSSATTYGSESPASQSQLKPQEREQVRRLIDPQGAAARTERDLLPRLGRVVVADMAAVAVDDRSKRLVAAVLYRYDDDSSTHVLVDLLAGKGAGAVLERQEHGGEAPFADIEMDRARSLAEGDEGFRRLARTLEGGYTLQFMRSSGDAPRVLRGLIATPQGYLTGYELSVDLRQGTASLKETQPLKTGEAPRSPAL